MAIEYFSHEEDWEADEWFSAYDLTSHYEDFETGTPFDVVTIAVAIVVIIGLVFGFDFAISNKVEQNIIQPVISQPISLQEEAVPPPGPIVTGPTSVAAPYDQYILTQGVHGLSYGHMAIDIAAGKGVSIKSPISGDVSDYYFDAIGNPTLVIENQFYRVTMLHGEYIVSIGDELTIGDPVGTESNLGNTRDMQGRSCRGRDCGYHTHLNVFDKKANSNVNPLDIIDS